MLERRLSRELVRYSGGLSLGLLLSACGGGSTTTPVAAPSPTAPSPPPTAPGTPTTPPASLTATITITAANTFQPAEVTILAGGRVTFVNQNNRAYDITSDPRHLHTDCPPVLDVGFIVPGQTKQTGPLSVVRTCGFHDHMQETNEALQGRIIVQGNPQ